MEKVAGKSGDLLSEKVKGFKYQPLKLLTERMGVEEIGFYWKDGEKEYGPEEMLKAVRDFIQDHLEHKPYTWGPVTSWQEGAEFLGWSYTNTLHDVVWSNTSLVNLYDGVARGPGRLRWIDLVLLKEDMQKNYMGFEEASDILGLDLTSIISLSRSGALKIKRFNRTVGLVNKKSVEEFPDKKDAILDLNEATDYLKLSQKGLIARIAAGHPIKYFMRNHRMAFRLGDLQDYEAWRRERWEERDEKERAFDDKFMPIEEAAAAMGRKYAWIYKRAFRLNEFEGTYKGARCYVSREDVDAYLKEHPKEDVKTIEPGEGVTVLEAAKIIGISQCSMHHRLRDHPGRIRVLSRGFPKILSREDVERVAEEDREKILRKKGLL